MPCFALRYTKGGDMEVWTDAEDLRVLSIDENAPGDRVYRMSSVHWVTPAEFDALIGNDPVHIGGDKPLLEQALRAFTNRDITGRAKLRLVEKD